MKGNANALVTIVYSILIFASATDGTQLRTRELNGGPLTDIATKVDELPVNLSDLESPLRVDRVKELSRENNEPRRNKYIIPPPFWNENDKTPPPLLSENDRNCTFGNVTVVYYEAVYKRNFIATDPSGGGVHVNVPVYDVTTGELFALYTEVKIFVGEDTIIQGVFTFDAICNCEATEPIFIGNGTTGIPSNNDNDEENGSQGGSGGSGGQPPPTRYGPPYIGSSIPGGR